MKIAGRTPGQSVMNIVFKRPEGDIKFVLKAIKDRSEFGKICEPVKPPLKMLPGGQTVGDTSNPIYLKALMERANLFHKWCLIKGLEDTPGLEWEKVIPDDLGTYHLLEEEFLESGINDGEVLYLLSKMGEINVLSEDKMDEARKTFLPVAQAG